MLQPNARLIRIVLLLPFTIAAQGSAQNRGLDPALAAGPSPGQTFTNIFSRTTTYKTEGFDEVIQQVSGNATYMVKTATRQKLVLRDSFMWKARLVIPEMSNIGEMGVPSAMTAAAS
jgi:hypothetical protein